MPDAPDGFLKCDQGEVPVIPARPFARPRTLVPVVGLAAALGLGLALAAPADHAAGQATADAGPKVVRTTIPLAVGRKQLGSWRPLAAWRGAKIVFRGASGRGDTVLRLADRPRKGGFVGVSASLGPQTAVGGKADMNLIRQRLGRGRARALLTVDSAKGGSVQAGVIRVAGGRNGLRWALWFKDNGGDRSDLVVSRAHARLRAWHTVQVATRWGRAGARASLEVDGKTVLRGVPRDLSGVVAQRVTLGLGRPSAENETGAMLVRSASVKAAIGVPGAGGRPGGTAPASPPAGGSTPANPTIALPGRELMRADWETGNLSQWDSVQAVSSDRIQVVGSPVRQGTRAGKFTVHSGDDPLGGNYGDRAEVSLDTNESEGDERWYAWSTMVGTDMPRTNQFQVISQWHSQANGQPPVAFFAENDSLVLMIHPHSSPGNLIRYVRAWSGPLRRGEWQDITMHVKWSGSDAIGFVELWINGARQTFSDGTQTMRIRTTYPGIGNYFKQGYYRQFGISQSGTVYHDGFRMNAPG